MNPTDYQNQASRTECVQANSLARMNQNSPDPSEKVPNSHPSLSRIRLNHVVIGLAGEVGELASQIQKAVYYGKPLDKTNMIEELGDVMWYVALACNALGVDLGNVMTRNIEKLRARYPEKWSEENAAEENRDKAKELAALVAENHGKAVGQQIEEKWNNPDVPPADRSGT